MQSKVALVKTAAPPSFCSLLDISPMGGVNMEPVLCVLKLQNNYCPSAEITNTLFTPISSLDPAWPRCAEQS